MEGCGRKIGPFDCCTIVEGDCLDVMAPIPANVIDLAIIDPPYGSGGRDGSVHIEGSAMLGNQMSTEAHIWFMRQFAQKLYRLARPDSHCYVFTDWRKFQNTRIAFETANWECRSLLVWDKGSGMGEYWRSSHEFILWLTKRKPRPLTHGGCFNVLRYPRVAPSQRIHKAEKPLELLKYLIQASLLNDCTVADFFLGSGASLVAAQELGCHFFGCDIHAEYVAAAEARLSRVQLSLL